MQISIRLKLEITKIATHYHLRADYHQPVSGFQQGYHPRHATTTYYPQRPQYGYGYDPHSYYPAWV
ncbi:hypothetical protein NC652_014997 [Populus alba x Populus x berolinensis]|nr:hypothetical protein NC652_014997 [Populus alba x Populus x berolinensis]